MDWLLKLADWRNGLALLLGVAAWVWLSPLPYGIVALIFALSFVVVHLVSALVRLALRARRQPGA